MRSSASSLDWLRGVDRGGVATWLLAFSLIAYLGLEGGGYDAVVHDQVGIAVWWLLLAGVVVGALPRGRFGPLAWGALAVLTAFVAWTALSLIWTESSEKTFADLARVSGYLGIFVLALALRGKGGERRLVSAVGAGIVLIAGVALLSRLHPSWFPAATETAQFLTGNRERLSYPIHYWNGLGALLAVGFPLVLHFASGARSTIWRVLAAAALPAMMLTSFFTYSRAGIGAAVIALAVFILFASDRLPKLLTLFAAGIGGGILCLVADSRGALADGLTNASAETQGDEVMVIAVLVCLAVAAVQWGITAAMTEERRPRWSFVPRQQALVASGAAVVAILVALVALNAPSRAGDAWDEFKQADSPGKGSDRLISAAGQNRYAYWESAVDENATDPLVGTGSGTFEYWWARERTSTDTVRDTHSLYLQTFGELGIVGLALLIAFLAVVLIGGARQTLRAVAERRTLLAAALGGCLAFFLTAAFDWMWQIPVLAAALLILAAVVVAADPGEDAGDGDESGQMGWPARIGFGVVALGVIAAIAIPLATAGLLRESETEVREGDLVGALEAARSAENVQPAAATPRLQQALVLEQLGALDQAAAAAHAATARGSTNWRTWLVLSRVEAQRGRAAAAVAAYRQARSLNPESPLFDS